MAAEKPKDTFEIHNDVVENRLRVIAHIIQPIVPEGWGFALFLMSYEENGPMFYISSAQRAGVIHSVKAWLAKQEAASAAQPAGYYCQNCSRVEVPRQGGVCRKCMEMFTTRKQ